jgi:phage FluMu protein gp41
MTTCKGVVKDNIVVLEDGAQLPDGAEVEVRLLKPLFPRDEVFAQVLANRIMHDVGMDQIIEEDKQEREELMDGQHFSP